uniref:Uncharacterized protein LOC105032763 isoform X2 n=1 Tax=Elaeis guineensis var. tenera TaxID=51953 RepID=A0A6I9QAA1_ELAGV|nr:uncharacterized protein LOC105032763 isoform X2 [Elaeis guineensis]
MKVGIPEPSPPAVIERSWSSATIVRKMSTASFMVHSADSSLFCSLRPSISIQQFSRTKYQFVKVHQISGTRIWRSFHIHNNTHCATIGRNCHRAFLSENEFDHEPFWLSMIKDVGWSLKSLAIFLAEQPSQLRYIEWPTFQSTLKTSCLTLVLVAFLIVALSTVDSALCYILALLLRKAT